MCDLRKTLLLQKELVENKDPDPHYPEGPMIECIIEFTTGPPYPIILSSKERALVHTTSNAVQRVSLAYLVADPVYTL